MSLVESFPSHFSFFNQGQMVMQDPATWGECVADSIVGVRIHGFEAQYLLMIEVERKLAAEAHLEISNILAAKISQALSDSMISPPFYLKNAITDRPIHSVVYLFQGRTEKTLIRASLVLGKIYDLDANEGH